MREIESLPALHAVLRAQGPLSGLRLQDLFDAEGFALPAQDVRTLDPVFQWTLHTARQTLRDAGREGRPVLRYSI